MPIVHKDLTNPHYLEWGKFLRESDSWNYDEIRYYQTSELRRITQWAYDRTSGYRKSFDERGVSPHDISSPQGISAFPVVTKSDIRDNLDSYSTEFPDRFYITTGGSTGVPTGMYRDPISFAKELASKAHQYHRAGWKEGDRQIVFRGLKIESNNRTEFVEELNELRCSTYEFGTELLESYVEKAFEFRPDWIRCYPSSGYVLTSYLKESGKSFPKVKGILCSSEQLFDFQKKLFKEVFGNDVRVFCHYGHYEMAALAGFCEFDDRYHVLPQYGYVELLDRDGRQITRHGEVGEIIATSFIMHATPFIRYKTEDLAVFAGFGCDMCGRPYQIWDRVEGRLQELITTPGGRLISTSMLNMHDATYEHIKQFQFHQKSADHLIFRFIPRDNFSKDAETEIYNSLKGKLGAEINLILEQVEHIGLTKRGKHRLLIQELDLKQNHPALGNAISL
jgi:phenylacetate-CoA ligase